MDSYYRIVFIVDHVKMGRSMVGKIHLDDYAVEAAHGRHRSRIRAYRILVNPALVRLAGLVVTPTATSCQGEMHACGSPMHNDLDPYNIELSCAAESPTRSEPQQRHPYEKEDYLRRQLQRLVT